MTTAQQTFITQIAAYVQKYASSYGICVHSPIIAQAILESGWGESTLASKYHNYFGLKCGTAWTGKSVNMTTQEEYTAGTLTTITDNFRVYDSMEEGVKGYFEFIQLARYSNLKGITDPQTYLETIKSDGYATSSTYVANCMALVTQYNLTIYDTTGGTAVTTEASLRKSVATWGDKYLGIAEGGAEHKAILAIFNNSGLCSRYTMTTSDAWCATFVSAAFISLGLTGIFPCVECSCPNMITLAKSAGIWVEDDSYTPGVGDVIMYDWQDSGSGDNTGVADHVGIVYTVSGSTLKIIEGNKNDTVAYRTMQVNGKYIRGYIAPDYASAAGTTSNSTSTSTSASATAAATTSSATALSVDGEIGPLTVTKLQAVLGTTQDGFIDGQQPASKIYWASVSTDACKWTGGASPMVIALQALVGVDQDGLLGVKTAKATQTYLINAGYSCGDDGADGYFGENSAKALQTWLNSK